jgi:hypothetical protein
MPQRSLLEKHLTQAELRVSEGVARLVQQRQIIEELAAAGRDTDLANSVLHLLEQTQALHVTDRDRLRAELASIGDRTSNGDWTTILRADNGPGHEGADRSTK